MRKKMDRKVNLTIAARHGNYTLTTSLWPATMCVSTSHHQKEGSTALPLNTLRGGVTICSRYNQTKVSKGEQSKKEKERWLDQTKRVPSASSAESSGGLKRDVKNK
ncbi:hypothetical protein, unlikely [Trypanosoma brucei gambiense DAL972]|uniref:Uncharacterized protein n=1 Tax=Trypanosoma brucei gambiense (strain MHOM/CI/86/DAL972) TaxID=679716 RepID=C9ZIV6_TRYB9|nr:hypothetical protein, unlikely [Trypanosoma brucei gambiense DAL972]CBH09322.1 hypothetical protein, unlikely [Trypanosoma brucei gambiense DAL972]|eukprot:XP_011771630.1 hypothetical protein, unlikely [Trypanosoma brucei gambiense DAL972]